MTKETSEIIDQASLKISSTLQTRYNSGEISDWRNLNPEKALIAAEKCSKTKKRNYALGHIVPWNKGLTKHTDDRMKKMSVNLREVLSSSTSSSAKRFTLKQLREIIDEAAGDKFQLISDISCYRNKYQRFQFLCNVCNNIEEKNLMMLVNTPKCFKCHRNLWLFKFSMGNSKSLIT